MPIVEIPPAPVGKKYVLYEWKLDPWTKQKRHAKTYGFSAWLVLVDA